MSQAAVLRVGEVKGPAKDWLVSLLGSAATDDAEVRISLKRPASSIPDRPWTSALNDRRCNLIDKEFQGGLTAEEDIELADLTQEMERYIERVAPIPIAGARKLHQQLLELAANSATGA